jgi:hypothetical protein
MERPVIVGAASMRRWKIKLVRGGRWDESGEPWRDQALRSPLFVKKK